MKQLQKAELKRTMESLYRDGEQDGYQKLYEAIHTLASLGLIDRSFMKSACETDGGLYLERALKEDGFTDEWTMDAMSSDK